MQRTNNKIFGIGLSRTATTSLANALNILGIKTIHCPSDRTTFNELKSGKYSLSILNQFQGVADTPVVPFYPQFDRAFPESRFILTVRQIDSWIRSMERHMGFLSRSVGQRLSFYSFIDACVYGTLEFNEDRLRYVYETHLRNVMHYFGDRPGDLLVLNICNGEGWEKLCPFLGIPNPGIPFPRLNGSRGTDPEWIRRLDAAILRMTEVLPAGVKLAIPNYKNLCLDIAGAVPFIEQDGIDMGAPEDDKRAIEQVHHLRKNGVQYIAFLKPFFWWLEEYPEMNRYLNANFKSPVKDDQVIIFHLE